MANKDDSESPSGMEQSGEGGGHGGGSEAVRLMQLGRATCVDSNFRFSGPLFGHSK